MQVANIIHRQYNSGFNNDNVIKTVNINNNDNVKIRRSEAEVNSIAGMLVEKLSNPESRRYYCKVAMSLSESEIAINLETALRSSRDPQRYFTWLCQRAMTR